MRGLLHFFLIGLVTAAGAANAGTVVKEIEIRNEGEGRIDSQHVAAHTTIRVGSELDLGAVKRDVKALTSTGGFSDATFLTEKVPGGVKLIYLLRNRLRLGVPLIVVGCEFYSTNKIAKLLELKVGDAVDDRILGEKKQKVLEKYRTGWLGKSFPEADLDWMIRVTDKEEGLAAVTVKVSEGPPSRVREVVFEGNASVPDSVLREALLPPSWWNAFRWLSRDRYERDNVQMAQVRIREIYLNMGYLEAEVDPPDEKPDPNGNLTITYRIREGIRYRFGKISVSGNKLYPGADLLKTAELRETQVASHALIGKGERFIADYYGSRGYIDTTAKPSLNTDRKTGIVDVKYVIEEGALIHVRNVRIQGNDRTRDKVIRREILVRPGEVYNAVKVRRSERILQNLGFFETVRADDLGTLNPGERDLVFEVEEKQTGQFHIGAGFSSIDRLMGFAELSQGNFDLFGWPYFTGGGQKLRLRTEYGSTRKSYTLDFTEPWFLDRKLAFGFDVGRTEYGYSDYDVKRTGAGVSLAKPLPGDNRVTLRYRLERIEITDVADTNLYVYLDPPHDEFYFVRNEDRIKSSVRLSLTHDTRNRPFNPTRGNQSTLYGEAAGGPLGFDTDMYEVGLHAGQYIPLWLGHVLYVRTRWEVVEAYGDTDEVPLSERLFIGGGRTLRGYDYRDVGPKVVPADPEAPGARTYRAAGGQTLALAKADYSIPLVTGIRLAAFYDIGNVWRDAYDFQLGNLASSAGVGIRLDIPGFPISIDRAWPVKKDNAITDTDDWVFWIGYDF